MAGNFGSVAFVRLRFSVLTLLLLFTLLAGCDTPAENPATPIASAAPVSNWYQVYFSDPTSPKAETNRGGPDERLASAIRQARMSVDIAMYNLTDSGIKNAQPILIDCAHGEIAICHNGNLVNAQELREMLVREGSIFQTTSDTEVLLHLYARSKAPTPEQALIESVSQAQGAFSIVVLTKDRLIAVRDPHGFRPLTLGRLGDSYIVCSETCDRSTSMPRRFISRITKTPNGVSPPC